MWTLLLMGGWVKEEETERAEKKKKNRKTSILRFVVLKMDHQRGQRGQRSETGPS